MRLEVVFDIDPERAFGQVADMSVRRDHLVARAEIALYGCSLEGGLDYNKICHNK